jgi:rhamnosyltransferase subunit B
MSQIVVTTIGSLGDLHPQIALAIELHKRGHDIIFATMKEYGAIIEPLGFEFHPMRPDGTPINNPEEIAKMTDLKTGSEYVVRKWLLPNLRDTYTNLLDSATDADLIIAGDIVYAAPLVAEKLGIPWVSLALAPVAFFSAYDPSVIPLFPFLVKLRGLGTPINQVIIQLLKAVTQSWAEPIHQLRTELGLSKINYNPLVDKSSACLVLAMFSSILAKPQPDWAKNTVVTGFTFYEGDLVGGSGAFALAIASPLENRGKLPLQLQQFLDAGEAPIVFTLGSAAVIVPGTFYQESVRAVTQLNRRAVLLIGKNIPPDGLSKDIIAIDYVPYSQIFPHACAIVHQGGIGTTAQALRAGRPTLIMPYSYDQPDNAARVKRLGTSRTIDRSQYTAVRVAKELQALLENPNYATKATEIGRIIQMENGVSAACDAIEDRLKKIAFHSIKE